MIRIFFSLLLLVSSQIAQAEVVGRVLLSLGEVAAIRDGRAVPLASGASVETGDRIRTGAASNAQIRFTDSAIVALRPESEFRIDEYLFNGRQDGSERAVFGLIKGGFRTITGLIGRTNQRNYNVRSPTATVGIRGTHFNLVHCENDCRNEDGTTAPNGTYGGVSDGRVSVTPLGALQPKVAGSPAERDLGGLQFASLGRSSDAQETVCEGGCPGADGRSGSTSPSGWAEAQGNLLLAQAGDSNPLERVFGAGEFFRVPDANTPAFQLIGPPSFLMSRLEGQERSGQKRGTEGGETAQAGINADGRAQQAPPPPPPPPFIATEVKNASGQAAVLPPVAGWVAAVALPFKQFDFGSACQTTGCRNQSNVTSTFNGQNQLLGFVTPDVSGSLGSGTMADAGSYTLADGSILTWGAWTGPGTSFVDSGTSYSGVPFLWAATTGLNNALPKPSSGDVAFSYVGGPNPRDFSGNVGQVTSSTVAVNFSRRSAFLSMAINFPTINASFDLKGGAGQAASWTSTRNDFGWEGPLLGTCTGSGCASTSPNGTYGTFGFGSGGKTTAYDFGVAVGGFVGTTGGSVAFLNGYIPGPLQPGPGPINNNGVASAAVFGTNCPNQCVGADFAVDSAHILHTATDPGTGFNSNLATSWSTPAQFVAFQGTGTQQMSDGGQDPLAGNLTWVRWMGAGVSNGGLPFGNGSVPPTWVHTITGDLSNPSSLAAINGTVVSFTYVGGTSPTDLAGNLGVITNRPTAQINLLSAGFVSLGPINIVFPALGTTYQVSGGAGFSGATGNGSVSGSCISGPCNGVSGRMDYIITGNPVAGLGAAVHATNAVTGFSFANAYRR